MGFQGDEITRFFIRARTRSLLVGLSPIGYVGFVPQPNLLQLWSAEL